MQQKSRKRIPKRITHQQYENLKKEIAKKSKSSADYERRIFNLAKRLGI